MNLFELFAVLTLDTSEYENKLNEAGKEADDFKSQWDKGTTQMASGMKNVAAGVGIFTAAGAGAFKFADNISKNLDNIDKMSQKLGLSTDAYQKWDYVMQISGTSIDNMSMGLKTLTNKFDEAVNGSDSAVQTFERLGLSMEDIQGLSREDLFEQVIYAFQGMEDSAERAALANDLLGRSGQELAPLFNTSAEETKKLMSQVEDLGGVMSESAVKQGAQFQDSLTSLKTAFTGAGASLAEELIPKITDLMDRISEFVKEGGLDKIINNLEKLAPVIAAVVAGFATFKIVTGVISVIRGFATAMSVLNAVLLANPIGIVIVAITALIAGIALLWNKSEAFRDFVTGMWEGLKAGFEAVVGFFSEAFEKIGGFFKGLGEKAGELKDNMSEKWNALKENTGKAWGAIKGKIEENGGGITGYLKTVMDGYKKIFEVGFNALNNITGGKFGEIVTNIANKLNDIKGKFKEKIDAAKTWGKDLIQNFIDGVLAMWNNLKQTVSNVAQSVKDFLGFSEPKKGPLSNFHTYAPDMMDLFMKGIDDNEDKLKATISHAFDFQDLIDHPVMSVSTNRNNSAGRSAGNASNQPIVVENHIWLEGDSRELFKVVRQQNRINTKATGYNALATMG